MHEVNVANNTAGVLEMNLKINQSEKTINELKSKQQNFLKQLEGFKDLNFKIEDFNLRLKTTDKFIDKYLPFYMQAQISETLHSCFNSILEEKLIKFEEKKFKELNTNIMNDKGDYKPNRNNINGIYEILENVIKRSSKIIYREDNIVNRNESRRASQLYINV